MLTDKRSGYGLVSILFHWITAILVVGLFGLGLYMVGLSYYDAWYQKGPPLHISLGLTLMLLMVARVLWRLINWRKPAPLPEHSRAVIWGSGAVQLLLYIMIFTVIITGYLMTTSDGRPARLFDLMRFPVLIRLGPDGVDRAGLIHFWCAWGIIVLASLHGIAALIHHFVWRDRTLMRMIKPARREQP
ncbi:cytochrome b [Marinimicrobium alkaliphilum]|uniref:cytochrome b n=1 Tax=Marinimicrobium alkaliphilum TaxID=2202654 RepID=UPI000DB9082E|nr:cytochrome b [Marinimicrobium alkaliphilum]